MYSFHQIDGINYTAQPIFVKVSDHKRMPVGHVVLYFSDYYDLLWRILFYEIIILCIAKLQYVP